ncbi:M3 family metallopeptidase [Acidihalobacter prosperus]|uniref:oligopeptidase A n=1 Tax=Acidihalobacter prosperus TaxID=160660 RepID=A0A1A6C4T9_9GAMM|nr:M3 family metallopeptidase [Acidihalobacter prosperus]OBS09577.1 oligopeptidase A [Acidihalobacter prosperus]
MYNPLLESHGLPAFASIEAAHVVPAITQKLADNRRRILERLDSGEPANWNNVAEWAAELDEGLERVWSPVRHLNAVSSHEALREAYNACLPLISAYHTELGHNRALYELWRDLSERAEELALDETQRKLVDDTLRDFHLSGVDLAPADKEVFSRLQQRLSALQSKFEENLLDATDGWSVNVSDQHRLAGMTPSGLAQARQAAATLGEAGYRLTLDFPSYDAVISYCDDRDLREQIYTAYATRASDQGPQAGRWNNSEIMCEILDLRLQLSHLLGMRNFAEESLMTKMASSAEEVMDFLRDLAERSRQAAQRELDELRAFAAEQLDIPQLQSWDMAYATQKLREHRYQYSEEEVKAYFPVDRVLQGLFNLANRLFGISISLSDAKIETWHEDVRFYDVHDSTGELRAQFYVDLHARKHKRGGAWMDECRAYHAAADGVRHPVAYLTCNSSPPVDGKPGLFTHDEVVTLFHEFGHGLHHMLTRVPYAQLSGIRGVEWDAVELPSQFMENWCWQDEVIESISGHYETGASLPATLRASLLATRDFQAGMQMLRQVEFAMVDMRLHMLETAPNAAEIQAIVDEVRQEVAVVRPPAFNRFQHSFAHIFGGGYAAGYYSYKWAEVLSADAFAKFEEKGLFDSSTGTAFLENILEMGGSKPAMELFKRFRGREPRIDALLKHMGIAA